MKENIMLKIIRRSCRLICHQEPEKSFKIKNYRFPICARCTGIITSFLIALIFIKLSIKINMILSIVFLGIMFLDWLIQFLKIKESTNTRRFITGLIGGFGMSFFYYYIICFFIIFLS